MTPSEAGGPAAIAASHLGGLGFKHARTKGPHRAPLSGCHFRLLVAQRKAAQIVRGCLRLAACGEKGATVSLQEANPGLDIAGMPQLAVE
jgi:hypothetical protein